MYVAAPMSPVRDAIAMENALDCWVDVVVVTLPTAFPAAAAFAPGAAVDVSFPAAALGPAVGGALVFVAAAADGALVPAAAAADGARLLVVVAVVETLLLLTAATDGGVVTAAITLPCVDVGAMLWAMAGATERVGTTDDVRKGALVGPAAGVAASSVVAAAAPKAAEIWAAAPSSVVVVANGASSVAAIAAPPAAEEDTAEGAPVAPPPSSVRAENPPPRVPPTVGNAVCSFLKASSLLW